VEIKKPGTSNYVAAKAGDQISQDTIISTALRSMALVEIGSAVVMVQPLTRLSLTEISASTSSETINVNLQAGRVRIDVNPPAGRSASMTVTSPSATASVRGTSFDLSARNLNVQQGTVSFTGNRGKLLLVNAGSDSQVKTDGSVGDPLETRSGRLLPPLPVGMDTLKRSVQVEQLSLILYINITLIGAAFFLPQTHRVPYWESFFFWRYYECKSY